MIRNLDEEQICNGSSFGKIQSLFVVQVLDPIGNEVLKNTTIYTTSSNVSNVSLCSLPAVLNYELVHNCQQGTYPIYYYTFIYNTSADGGRHPSLSASHTNSNSKIIQNMIFSTFLLFLKKSEKSLYTLRSNIKYDFIYFSIILEKVGKITLYTTI